MQGFELWGAALMRSRVVCAWGLWYMAQGLKYLRNYVSVSESFCRGFLKVSINLNVVHTLYV